MILYKEIVQWTSHDIDIHVNRWILKKTICHSSEVFGGGLLQILISVQNTLSLMQSFVNTLTKIPDINDHILQLESQF